MPHTSNIPWYFPINRARPLVPQIVDYVEGLIRTRRLNPGQRVISKSAYAKLLNVSKKTVENAYLVLKSKKLTESVNSSGTFVIGYHWGTKLFRDPLPAYSFNRLRLPRWKPNVSYLSVGVHRPQTLMCHNDRLLRNYRTSVHDQQLSPHQINQYLSEVLLYRNIDAAKEQIAVIHGAGRNINVLSLALLRPGDTVVFTSPEDKPAQAAFGLTNARVMYTGSDNEGMDLEKLKKLTQRHRIKALFIRPASDITTGFATSRERREAIMDLALQKDFVIIEAYNEHEFWSGENAGTFWEMGHHERVIYLSPASVITNGYNSLSLIIATSQFVRAVREHADGFSAYDLNLEKMFIQSVQDNTFSRMIEEAIRVVKKVRQDNRFLLENYLGNYVEFTMPEAGQTVWLKLKEPMDPTPILPELEALGMYSPGSKAEGGRINAIRYGLGSPLEVQEKVCKLFSKLYSSTMAPFQVLSY